MSKTSHAGKLLRQKLTLTLRLVWVLIGTMPFASAEVLGSDTTPSLPADARRMERGAIVYLTPSGQEFFYKNAANIIDAELRDTRYGLRQGNPEDIVYESKTPYTEAALRELLSKYPNDPQAAKAAAAFEELQKAIRVWLTGFELKDPRFKITASGIDYSIKYSRIGIRLDPNLAVKEKIQNGIVLVAEAEASDVRVGIAQLRAQDLSNTWLGRFGLDAIATTYRASSAQGSTPLRVMFPIVLTVRRGQPLGIRALPAISNIQKTPLVLNYGRLILPTVSLIGADGKDYPIDTSAIETEIVRQKAGLVKGLQAFVKDYISTDATTFMESQIRDLLKEFERGYFDTTTAPLAPNDAAAPLTMGFEPTQVQVKNGTLILEATSAIEDPWQRVSPPLLSYTPVNAAPFLGPIASHLAISVKSETVDRILQHSFLRGYLKNINLGDNTWIDLLLPPTIRFQTSGAFDRAVLKLRIKTAAPTTLGITDGYVVFDVDLKVRIRLEDGALEIINEELDLNTLVVSAESINWLGAIVKSQIADKLKKSNLSYRAKKNVLTRISLPKNIQTVTLHPTSVRVENSYLTLFFNFGFDAQLAQDKR